MEEIPKFEEWCLIELMGHQQLIGFVTQRSLGGANMLRVDVPEVAAKENLPAMPAFTKYVSASALYGVTPVSEEFARAAVGRIRAKPHSIYVPELFPPDMEKAPAIRYIAGRRLPGDIDDDDDSPDYEDREDNDL